MQVTIHGLLVLPSLVLVTLSTETFVCVSDCNRICHVVRELQLCVCACVGHNLALLFLCVAEFRRLGTRLTD